MEKHIRQNFYRTRRTLDSKHHAFVIRETIGLHRDCIKLGRYVLWIGYLDCCLLAPLHELDYVRLVVKVLDERNEGGLLLRSVCRWIFMRCKRTKRELRKRFEN